MNTSVSLARMAFAFVAMLALGILLLGSPVAHAANLQVAPDSPAWMQLGAAALLWLHIGGGAAGIVTGMLALASPKGRGIHRSAGKVFFGVMLVSYTVAATVAPFLLVEQRTNTVAGLMALYLLLSGWGAVRHKEITAGPWQVAGLVTALGIAGAGALFMREGANSPTGTVDGAPPEAFVVFITFGLIAAAGEINVLLRGKISGPARLARHLWRMCTSLFIASGSFFLGQMRFLPDWVIDSQLNLVLALAPLVGMLVYLVVVRIPKRRKVVPAAE